MSRRRIDYDPNDGSGLAALLNRVVAARGAEDLITAAAEYYRAEGLARDATNEAIAAALEAGYSARQIAVALGMTHAAVTARARAARGQAENNGEEGTAL